jgi:DNA-binding CsgD family transcriptional regulator
MALHRFEVFQLPAEGKSNKEVADHLGISTRTAEGQPRWDHAQAEAPFSGGTDSFRRP